MFVFVVVVFLVVSCFWVVLNGSSMLLVVVFVCWSVYGMYLSFWDGEKPLLCMIVLFSVLSLGQLDGFKKSGCCTCLLFIAYFVYLCFFFGRIIVIAGCVVFALSIFCGFSGRV